MTLLTNLLAKEDDKNMDEKIITTPVQQLVEIAKELDILSSDLSSPKGKSPSDILMELEARLYQLQLKAQLEESAKQNCIDKLQALKARILPIDKIAENVATNLSISHAKVISRITNFYSDSWDCFTAPRATKIMFANNTFSIFESTATAHHRTWNQLKENLIDLSNLPSLQKHKQNSLGALLETKIHDFMRAVESGELPIGAEIGHLAIQRLRHIASTSNVPTRFKREANTTLKHSLTGISDSLLHCDNEALKKEIWKLALYALLNPDQKIAWIGTARAVNAAIKNKKPIAMYFNPTDKCHTWELNRAWLQAAVKLGYEFKLVEQHFPNIESAIFSGNPAFLVAELAKEIRPRNKASQYNSSYGSPTATPQEMLVLMELGCVGKKNPDGSISLLPPQRKEAESVQTLRVAKLKRNHSCPDFFKAAPPPMLTKTKHHFESPSLSISTSLRQ